MELTGEAKLLRIFIGESDKVLKYVAGKTARSEGNAGP